MLEIGPHAFRAADQELHEGSCLLEQAAGRSTATTVRQVGPTGFPGNQAGLALSRVALCPAEHGGDVQKPVTWAISRQGSANSWRRHMA